LVFFLPLGVFFVMAGLQALGLAFDHDPSGHHDHDGFDGFLDTLGLSGAPLAFLWMPLALVFGVCGLLFRALFAPGWGGYLGSIGLALVCGLISSWMIGRVMRRFFPTHAATLDTRRALLGKAGKVHSPTLNHSIGEVVVADSFGNTLYHACRVHKDISRVLQQGEEVVLVEYDEEHAIYVVSPLK
jgi:hypothetical protein